MTKLRTSLLKIQGLLPNLFRRFSPVLIISLDFQARDAKDVYLEHASGLFQIVPI